MRTPVPLCVRVRGRQLAVTCPFQVYLRVVAIILVPLLHAQAITANGGAGLRPCCGTDKIARMELCRLLGSKLISER